MVEEDRQRLACQCSLDLAEILDDTLIASPDGPRDIRDQARLDVELSEAKALVERNDVATWREIDEHDVGLSEERLQEADSFESVPVVHAPCRKIAHPDGHAVEDANRVEGGICADDLAALA